MTSVATALYNFFSGFGVPAYTTDNVPDDVTLPYITYSFQDSEWDTPVSMYAQVYMHTNLNSVLLSKANEIREAIGSGISIPCDEGRVVLFYEQTQLMSDGDNGVRSAYISLELNCFHL